MPEKVICLGCRRLGVTDDPNLFCAQCKADLKRSRCAMCDEPVSTDIPRPLCAQCSAHLKEALAKLEWERSQQHIGSF